MKKFGSSSRKTVFYVLVVFAFVLSATIAGIFIFKHKRYYAGLPTNEDLQTAWKAKNYETVYRQTAEILERRPFDTEVLALHGFAAYYLSSTQTKESEASTYLDECITALRKALYDADKTDLLRLYYILGKAYFQKGYFYYDLALKYLDMVFYSDVSFPDINKFRAMAFSYLGEDEKAIEAFTHDLNADSDEFLLYALAKNYINVGNFEKAKMYLTEAADKAKDVLVKLDCKSKLAEVYLQENKLEKARAEYESILEINEKYADAYYGLGEVYERAGDLVRARSEWRKALKINPLHAQAIEKLRSSK